MKSISKNSLTLLFSLFLLLGASTIVVSQEPADQQLSEPELSAKDHSGYYLFPRWKCEVTIAGEEVTMTYTIKTNKGRKHWDFESFEPVVNTEPDGKTSISGELRMRENPSQENHGTITVVKTVMVPGLNADRSKLDVGLIAPDGTTDFVYKRKKKGLMSYD